MRRAVEVALGLVFLAAGPLQAADPGQAAMAVDAYDLLPPRAALAVGLWLPGVEAAVGAALLAGWFASRAAALAAALSVAFLAAVGGAAVRGLDVQCGCFGPLLGAFDAGWHTAALDLALLAGAVYAWRGRGGAGAFRGAAAYDAGPKE